jgi:hypothetical protein
MNHQYVVLSIFLFLIVSGFVCADSVSSSIVCDGASWVSSSVTGPDTSISQSLFTTDPALILRDLTVGETVQTRILARSAGPMGIDELSSTQSNQIDDPRYCLFDIPKNQSSGRHETSVLGLLRQGVYSSSGSVHPDDTSRFLLDVNGTGIILTRAVSSGTNQTVTQGSDVAGEMNMTEVMQFGDNHGI